MSSVLLGLLTAVCWGWADVLARFTGRALGARTALFGMMLAGAAGLTIWIIASGQPLPAVPSWWTVGTALLAMVAMLLFYEAMRRGPVSLVSPATGAYPAWAMMMTMALGVRPPLLTLLAMAMTLAGVLLVARFAAPEPNAEQVSGRTATFALAMTASVMFAVTLLVGQQAILRDGTSHVLWWGRTTAVILLGLLILRGRRRTASPVKLRACALTALQGVLDTLGLVFVFAAGRGLEAAMATISSSAFGVVTVLLARVLYRERISPGQAAGIVLVFAGVAALAAPT
jgi:drug/metabolite transporter (DMT)-like permease